MARRANQELVIQSLVKIGSAVAKISFFLFLLLLLMMMLLFLVLCCPRNLPLMLSQNRVSNNKMLFLLLLLLFMLLLSLIQETYLKSLVKIAGGEFPVVVVVVLGVVKSFLCQTQL